MALDDGFVAIIADLVGSRDLPNRAEVQRTLREVLRPFKTRQPIRGLRARGPDITAGDEVQLLLRVETANLPGHATLAYLRELTEDLHPVRVVFGIGVGTVSTGVAAPIQQLDGSCFHRARRALETAKREGRWACIAGVPKETARATNAILRITGDLRASWTDRQREMIGLRRRFPTQKDVALELDVSPSVVSEVLSAARHDAILEAELAVESLLNRGISPESFPPWLDEVEDA